MSSYKGQRPSQQAVRVGRFEQAMAEHDSQTGQKVAAVLTQYNHMIVLPMEERLARIETVLGIRLFLRVKDFTISKWRYLSTAILSWSKR